MTQIGEILDGVWRFEARHPEWTEDEGGDEDGWEPEVGWWGIRTGTGLVLIDPLVEDWDTLDRLVDECGGCAGVIRTCHWHQRSIGDVALRYEAQVWARAAPDGVPQHPYDHSVGDGEEAVGGLRVTDVERADEIALWLPEQRALVFGDAMLRRGDGSLRVCPDSWTQPEGGPARLREILGGLVELPVEHVLVSHGPVVTGEGLQALRSALG